MTLPVLLLSCSVVLISTFVFHDHHHRKAFVGSVGLVASVAMYGSPLVVVVSTFVNWKIHILLGRFLIYIAVLIMSEKSDTDEERGIHAILPVAFLISSKFALDGIWTFEPRSFPCG